MSAMFSVQRGHEGYQLVGPDGYMIADGMDARGAEKVLTACNAHDGLVEATKLLLATVESEYGELLPGVVFYAAVQTARAALAKAGST